MPPITVIKTIYPDKVRFNEVKFIIDMEHGFYVPVSCNWFAITIGQIKLN